MATSLLQRAGITVAALAGMATLVAGIWLLRTFDPNAAGSPFPACLFKTLTGFYCAGCGATRALHALVHGNVGKAFSMNPLLMAALPLLPLLATWSLGWRPAWLRPFVHRASSPMLWLFLLSGFWILRNLPWAPFNWLAPG